MELYSLLSRIQIHLKTTNLAHYCNVSLPNLLLVYSYPKIIVKTTPGRIFKSLQYINIYDTRLVYCF
jgi:hypothetical protein